MGLFPGFEVPSIRRDHRTMKTLNEFYRTFKPSNVSGLSKYAQLKSVLLKAIDRGYWRPGEKLPNELEIAATTPFGLGTVQRALKELSEEGIIVRRKGQGSYVSEARSPMVQPWHCRFWNDDKSGFLPIYPRVLSRQRLNRWGAWSTFLEQSGDNIVLIERRISINDEFYVLSRFYVNADRFGFLLDRPLSELDQANLKGLIVKESGLPVTRVSQNLKMEVFEVEVCDTLAVKPGTVGLHVEIVAHAGKSVHMYYQELFIPPSGRELHISDGRPFLP